MESQSGVTRVRLRERCDSSSTLNPDSARPSSSHFSRLASRFFPAVYTLQSYVVLINASLGPSIPPITLVRPNESSTLPSYASLVSRVLVCVPDSRDPALAPPLVPHGVEEGLIAPQGVSLEEIIARVVTSALTRYPEGFDAQNHNVLCNGFAIGRDGGPGSVLRNLDARAPSSAVSLFLSPPWRRIFARLGYVAARHLLSHTALVLGVPSAATTDGEKCGVGTIMQLCGPHREKRIALGESMSSIRLKRHVLYRGTVQMRTAHAPSISNEERRAPDWDKCSSPLNLGLPSTHPMQTLQIGDPDASCKLASIIFPSVFAKQFGRLGTRPGDVRDPSSRPKKRRRVTLATGIHAGNGIQNGGSGVSSCSTFPHRLQKLSPLLKDVVARCSKRSFRALLSETCPLGPDNNPRRRKRQRSCAELSAGRTKPGDVARFLVRAIRQSIPLAMFGSLDNRALFESAIHTFIRRRGQHETFDLGKYLGQQGLKVTDVTWLYRNCGPGRDGRKVCNPTDLRYRQSRLADFLSWLLKGFCLPLLRHNFYVTETEVSRNRVVYYRREVWCALVDATLNAMLRSDHRQFSMLSQKSLAVVRSQRESAVVNAEICFSNAPVFSFSSVRFVPKPSGARGIQRRRAISFQSFCGSRSASSSVIPRAPNVNVFSISMAAMKTFYANVLEILWSESRSNPSILGASVFSSNDIYMKYADLVSRWKAAGCPSMHFVCMDITRSFDTVPLASLLDRVLPFMFQHEEYVILRYVVVKRSFSNGALLYRYRYYACEEMGEESHFPRLLRTKLAARHRGALYIDLCDVTRLKRADLLSALKELLGSNIVAIPRRNRRRRETAYAIQCQGLPQGLPLSGILTSLFYGYVESNDLKQYLAVKECASGNSLSDESGLRDHKSNQVYLQMFMRQVDDTIFASADKNHARQFAERMTKGWDHVHGFVINPSKTRSNFDPGVGGKTNVRFIPWCGYIIDTKKMEVRNDYDRYVSPSFRIRDTLCVVYGTGAIQSFSAKAQTCFKPKLHAILLDPSINSKELIALNLYQAAVLSALKLSSYALALFSRSEMKSDLKRTCDIFRTIATEMVGAFRTLVTIAITCDLNLERDSMFPLEISDILFLIHRGFYDVLQRRLHIWFAESTKAAFRQRLSRLRFVTVRSAVQDLDATYSSVLQTSSSRAMWRIRL